MSSVADMFRAKLTTASELNLGLQAATKIARQKLNALELFRPTEYQEAVVLCEESEVLVKGGTRSGKSTIVAVMIAAYLLNVPITFADGTKHFVRELGWRKKAVIVWLIGLQLNHIGQTLYRLLRQKGAFDIVKDKKTGLWRAWQPGRIPGDELIPDEERFPAPPLIPEREIEQETWENKKEHKFTSMTMKNGSICYGFASTGDVKRGDPVNRIWIDENIANSDHYEEWQSRLSDRKGRIWWTSWPDMKTPAMLAVHRRAVAQMDEFNRGVRKKLNIREFTFIGSKSPFIDEEEKIKRSEGWTENQSRARDFGEFITDTLVAYPEFNRNYHTVDYGEGSPTNDKVTEAMRRLNWNAPYDWATYLILDPGTSRPALLWVAIPPRSFWDHDQPYHVVFREMNIPRIDAKEMAFRAKACDPGRPYVGFIGDAKAGDQTPPGFQWSIFAQYSSEFSKVGLRCLLTGDIFQRGETTWVTRAMKLKAWMRGRPCGRPQLRILTHMCPGLVKQLEETLKNVTKEDVQDKLAPGQAHDVLDCCEYYAGHDPVFVVPPPAPAPMDPGTVAYQSGRAMMERLTKPAQNKPAQGRSIVLGIP